MFTYKLADSKRNIKYPENCNELAEFIGILFGDGYMKIEEKFKKNSKYLYYVFTISGHSEDDREYLTNHVSNLIKYLFNIKPKIKYRKNQKTMFLRIISKGIIVFLMSKGVPLSPKNNLIIPNWIKNNPTYLREFTKGLTDTDGSIALKNRNKNKILYPVTSISNKNKKLIIEIDNYINKIGINTRLELDSITIRKGKKNKINNIVINGYPKTIDWLNKVGFSIQKHLRKVRVILEQRKHLKKNLF